MRKLVVFSFFLLCCFSISISDALDFSPWYGRNLEIQGRLNNRIQTYGSVNAKGSSHYSSTDYFLDGSLSIPVLDHLSGEIECGFLTTRRHSFSFDHLSLLARYLWWNDAIGDRLSLVTGVVITQVFKQGLHDISVFHHGGFEIEPNIAWGKEMSCEEFWTSRWWGLFGVGIADHGAPWIRANLQWENNHWDQHQWIVFVRSLWGLGPGNLHVDRFHGYGGVQHQSVDCGAKYQYLLESSATVGLEYAIRAYAHNCPSAASQFVLSIFYPFGVGI
ncbi:MULTISPECIES: hypothetical protein [Parachlamydia]|uniref:Uncharacterized protein n=2 Tax=Parachlamydia acanthamoebae TaxID=83552 RepID=F8L153_PARAV|nr:hypothetical protein [Parachlamydia acanthamoebae]EFB42556.1 hypothetical protein pah_c004o047 [Parachlamydia acanthamoebae str. Hall's coccus]KIA77327.1 hypothetical protein DB43_GM00120 [Parachlamydia acanthamoebae]CCB86972.1 putative uncharacterized protein [Parachlamydia acanthamoebae UV-7]